MTDALCRLLELPPASSIDGIHQWWQRHQDVCRGFEHSLDRAILGGGTADRIGYAFASGYTMAVRALVGSLDDEARGSFCATEAGGAHPRAIETTVEAGTLVGHKSFCTLGPSATDLVVIASEGLVDDRPRLVAYLLAADAPGVSMTQSPPTPMVPEIPHAVLSLRVPIDHTRRLEGDGYLRYLKAFRTCEDIHVMAALVAHTVVFAKHAAWPPVYIEQALATLAGLRATANLDRTRAATHVALAGLLDQVTKLMTEADSRFDDPRWSRDRVLFQIAQKTRDRRRARAWQDLTGRT